MVYSLMVWQAARHCGSGHSPEGIASPGAIGPQLATKVEVLLIFPVLDLGFAARSLDEDQHVQRHALSLDEVGHDAGDHHLLGAVQEGHGAARHVQDEMTFLVEVGMHLIQGALDVRGGANPHIHAVSKRHVYSPADGSARNGQSGSGAWALWGGGIALWRRPAACRGRRRRRTRQTLLCRRMEGFSGSQCVYLQERWFTELVQRVVVVRSLLELQGGNVVGQRLVGSRSQVYRLIESTAAIRVEVTHLDQGSGRRNREVRRDRDIPDGNPQFAVTLPDSEACTALASVLREYGASRRSRELELHLRAFGVRPSGGIHGVADLEDHAFPLARLDLGERLALAGFCGESPDDLQAGAGG